MCVSIFTATAGQVYAAGDAEAIFEVTNSEYLNDEITYTVKLTAGHTKVTGAIVKVAFDASVLEVVESHAAGSYNADGDFVENVAGVYETGLVYNEPGVCALAYMNANGFTIGNSGADLFVIKFRAISEERPMTSVEFVCSEFITDDGNDENDIKKATDGIQSISTHSFHTLSMPRVTEVNSVNDGLRVVWAESVGATSYTLYRKEAGASAWTLLSSDIGVSTEYIDNDIVKGTEYYYTVSSANSFGSTEYDETGLAGMNFGSIESINAVAVENGAEISWSALDGATSYEVYRKLNVTANWQKVTTVTTTKYIDKSISSGVVYDYKVKAINGKYSADMSCDPASVKFIAVPETTVSNSFDGIEIYFEEVGGAEKYVIEKKVVGGEYSVIAEIAAGVDNCYTDENVTADGQYIYRIQAVASDISSAKKELSVITRLGKTSVNEVSNNANGVYLSWNAVNGASNYSVFRRTADESIWTNCGKTSSTNYVDTDVVSGTDYIYFVCAENATGFGGYEAEIAFTYLSAPEISSVSTISEGIRVVWKQVQGAESYKVYRVVAGKTNWTEIANVTDLSYVDKDAVHGTYYKYTVSAVKGDFESAYNTSGVEGMYFGTVTSISANAVKNGAEVTWSALAKADGYYVYRKTAAATTWTKVATVSTNKYTDTGIESGVAYDYMVKAYNGKNIAEMTAEPAQVKYLAVPVLSVKNAANGIKITVTPVGGANGYVIEKETDGVFEVVATLGAKETTYTDVDVEGDTTYNYRVYATSTDLNSFVSDNYEITRLGCPKITTIKNVLPGVTLSWTPVDDAVEYEIYRKDEYNTEWEYFTTVTETTYTDGTVFSGETYTYTINAITSDGGYSGYDDTGKSVTFVETPDLKKAANTSAGVFVTWESVEGALYYRVYRRVSGGSWDYIGYTKGTSFVDKATLKSGTRYDYTVIAVNNNYSDFDRDGVSLVYLTTPKLTKVNNVPTGVSVTWGKVTGATGYRVYRKAGSATSWSYIGYTTKTNYIDTKVSNGIYYRYTIIAVNGTYSDFDRTGKNVKFVSTPKVTGVSNAATGIYVKWNAVKGATEYRVYRRKGGSMNWYCIGTTKNTYYTDKGIVNQSGTYYIYTVIAVNGYYSGFESGLTIKRLANPVLKSAVSYKSGIYVKWNPVKGTTGYYVYRKTAGSGWTKVGTMKGTNNTTFVDKTAKKGVTYTYTVRACSGSTLSAYNTKGISCKDRY